MGDAVRPASVSALAGIAAAGQRPGHGDGAAGFIVAEITGLVIASVAARRGRVTELATTFAEIAGLDLPTQPRRVVGQDVSVTWSGPEQWLVIARTDRWRTANLSRELAGLAAVTDQSDSRAVLEVSGPRVREVLAKGVMLDLHPRVFRPGDTAVTLVAHVGAQVTLIDPAPVFELMVPRSYCLSFWNSLITAGGEFGVAVAASTDRTSKF